MDRSLTVIRNTEPAEREIDDTELRALLIGQQSQSDEFLVRVLRQHMWVDVAPDPIMVYALNFGDVYDVIIIHRSLDGSDGSAATCQELRRAGMNVPIIVLGPHGTTDDLVEAFDAGADDFMFEPINAELLSARIRALRYRKGVSVPSTQRRVWVNPFGILDVALSSWPSEDKQDDGTAWHEDLRRRQEGA